MIDTYEDWLAAGAEVFARSGGSKEGFNEWVEASKHSPKFNLAHSEMIWRSFSTAISTLKQHQSVVVEDNVPMPDESAVGKKRVYPWLEMEVGSSFIHPSMSKLAVQSLVCTVNRHRKYGGRQFAVRETPEGYRVWRVK